MTDLNLTGQSVASGQIATRLATLRNLLLERKVIWDRIPMEKKKQWIQSGKDPVMTLAWDIFKWLRDNLFYDDKVKNDNT